MSRAAKDWAERQIIANGPMKAVLNQLGYMHKAGRELFPSQQRLADICGIDVRTVREVLWLLEHFGFITRAPRSRGAAGRTSDSIVVNLARPDQPLTARVIAAAKTTVRKTSSNRHRAPVGKKSQPERRSGGPGIALRGIGDEQKKELVQEQITTEVEVRDTREGQPLGQGLRVIAGGRS